MNTKVTKAVYIICPSLGIGEIYTIKWVSDRLLEHNVIPYYIGPHSIMNFSDIPKENFISFREDFNYNKRLLKNLIFSIRPDFIIFTDYNMYLNKRLGYQKILQFDDLRKYNIPIFIIDTLGNCSFKNQHSSLFSKECSVIVPEFVKCILRPVPQHDPINCFGNKRVRYFSLFSDKIRYDYMKKMQIKKQLNFEIHRKLVILPLGSWIRKITTSLEFKLFKSYIRIILYYLNCLEQDIDVCILGECDFEFLQFHNLIIHKQFKEWGVKQIDELFQVADLVITLNQFSNSLVRAVLYGVPCLGLVNSYEINDGSEQLQKKQSCFSSYVKKIIQLNVIQNTIKPFRIYPESNIEIIDVFFQSNKLYASQFVTEEIFNEDNVINVLKILINKQCESLIQKQLQFREAAMHLETIDKIILEELNGDC